MKKTFFLIGALALASLVASPVFACEPVGFIKSFKGEKVLVFRDGKWLKSLDDNKNICPLDLIETGEDTQVTYKSGDTEVLILPDTRVEAQASRSGHEKSGTIPQKHILRVLEGDVFIDNEDRNYHPVMTTSEALVVGYGTEFSINISSYFTARVFEGLAGIEYFNSKLGIRKVPMGTKYMSETDRITKMDNEDWKIRKFANSDKPLTYAAIVHDEPAKGEGFYIIYSAFQDEYFQSIRDKFEKCYLVLQFTTPGSYDEIGSSCGTKTENSIECEIGQKQVVKIHMIAKGTEISEIKALIECGK